MIMVVLLGIFFVNIFRSNDQYTSNNSASIQDIGKIEKGEFLLFGKLTFIGNVSWLYGSKVFKSFNFLENSEL